MDIDRCNSIFELFAAFNFAHAIISEKTKVEEDSGGINYSDILINTHLRIFAPFFDKGKELMGKIKGEATTCETLIASATKLKLSPSQKTELKSINSGLTTLLGLVTRWQNNVDEKKSIVKEKINGVFPFLSFLTAIFCIAVLGVGISESSFKHFTLLVLFLPTLLIYGLIFWRNGKNNYMIITNVYFVIIILLIIAHMILREFAYQKNGLYPEWLCFFDVNDIAKHILIFICMGLPFTHFIIFLYWGNRSFKRIKSTKESEIDSYTRQLKEWKDKLDLIANNGYSN